MGSGEKESKTKKYRKMQLRLTAKTNETIGETNLKYSAESSFQLRSLIFFSSPVMLTKISSLVSNYIKRYIVNHSHTIFIIQGNGKKIIRRF